jgi:Holliday junction DNA helicase RuvA
VIVRVRGTVESVEHNAVTLRLSGSEGLWLEVHAPIVVAHELLSRTGDEVELHTVSLLEQAAQGTTITPRLLGFLRVEERRLFELLTTVKGLGARRALRAMALPAGDIARAIADADTKTLKTLPEIGKRLAETIVVDLREKAEPLAAGAPAHAAGELVETKSTPGTLGDEAQRAVEALVRLGDTRAGAEDRVRKVISGDDPPPDADAILAAAFSAS